MIERGSGRTSGLTDWRLMDVPSMWACLQDQDTTGQWKQVAGWRKICDLALAHLSRLQEYRRGLAQAWPPETNAAARAYLGELDQLIDKVQRTHDAAAANYDALAAATRAIGSTRAELKPIHDEYAAKLQKKRAYEEILADPKAVAGSRLPNQPPVTDADLEQLNIRARSLMTGLSGELQQAQVMLRQPPPKPNIRRQPDEHEPSGGLSSVPVIPPIVPVPTTGKTSSSRGRPASIPPVPVETPTNNGPVLGTGPVLGGAGSGPAAAPTIPGASPLAPPSSTSQVVGPGVPLPTHQAPKPATPVGRETSKTVRERISPVGKPGVGSVNEQAQTSTRPLPPGGLIGGTPGMGLSQPNNKGYATRRINPIGGVIGGGGAGTAPSGAAGSRPGSGRASQFGLHNGLPPIGSAPGASFHNGSGNDPRGLGRDYQEQSRRLDPDNPWEIDRGVAPVMRPPDEEGPLDPGPAIGLDR